MPDCEDSDCGEEVRRRVLCYHCGLLVCPWCWHHLHGCQPGHTRSECWDYKKYRRYGRARIKRLRARQKLAQEMQDHLRQSFERWPCAECAVHMRSASPDSEMRCMSCGLSYRVRLKRCRRLVSASMKAVALARRQKASLAVGR